MPYSIFIRPGATRDLKGLPSEVRTRVEKAIARLQVNPRPPGAKKLVGYEDEWRLRVGDYRILYVVNDGSHKIVIARVAHRREAYR
jgi:mRNA interferase RelE/StbE